MSILDYQTAGTASDEVKQDVLDRYIDPKKNTAQATGDTRRHTDADSMRRHFGIPEWDRARFDYPTVLPNLFEHTWDAPLDEDWGGTDLLCRGKPGKGKSTFGNYLAIRMMEVNDEKVVWRGSTSRSEWMPLAPWTRLCIPKGVEIDARLESKLPENPPVDLSVEDLEEIVREVVRYEDPMHLNHEILQPGQFHVVYPDPQFKGCEEVYDASEERTYEAPAGRDELFAEGDPANHWWSAWLLARVEHGPYHWTTWIADEIGDIFPQSAQKDAFGSYQKVELVRDTWVDFRKFGLSAYMFAHSEKDVHQMIREKLRWRIQMRGTANPTTSSSTVGFESIPMNTDLTSDLKVGKALAYTETNFEKFAWEDVPEPTNYKLKLKLRI